jgi:5-methylcytosine-specific restriction endonuclease McrA
VPKRLRPPIPIETQATVYVRDGWLCQLCGAPTVFPLALKRLERFVKKQFPTQPLAYYNQQWRRDRAPLLDLLATCTDHRDAFSRGGDHNPSNFQLACARCNQRKGDLTTEAFHKRYPKPKVRAKYGEPRHWDGLATVFLALAAEARDPLSATERAWQRALESQIARMD